ncbi:hypothetical protein, partial [Parvimonas sp. D9]|uniref:hypothetical protein n=1 Tax=Parvimonas sp. D9 TaxID=3110689 RepID=UPI002B46727A
HLEHFLTLRPDGLTNSSKGKGFLQYVQICSVIFLVREAHVEQHMALGISSMAHTCLIHVEHLQFIVRKPSLGLLCHLEGIWYICQTKCGAYSTNPLWSM